MPPFQHHVFICCNQRPDGHPRGCCDAEGDAQLRGLFHDELARRGLKGVVRANKAGCLDQCELGPTVVIYPQGIWYGRVQPEDVPRIVQETLVEGRILPDLLISDEMLNTRGKGPDATTDSP